MAVLLEAGAELVVHLELLLGRQLPSERHHARERDRAWMGGRVREQCDGVNLRLGRGDLGESWGRWRGDGACADEGPVVWGRSRGDLGEMEGRWRLCR